MASPKSTNKFASEIADQAVAKWPDTPTKQLARMMMKKHKHVFPSLNAAMCAIRYRRGAMGKASREKRGVAAIASTPASIFSPINPLGLPESSAKDHEPFVMDGVGKCLILPDLHLPYHDLRALTVMLQDGVRNECSSVLINGDLLDFHTLSRFVKDPSARSFRDERSIAKQFLARLRELFPKARIVFKEGNHDVRLQHFVMEKAPELYDESILGLDVLLDLPKFGIEHVKDKREIMLGKLYVLHGHELPRGISAPVNPARGAFLRAKVSVLVSHSHRTSEHTETPMDRSIVSAWSTGCACYSSDTDVLTDRGFVPFPELLETDRVAEYDPDTRTTAYRVPIARQVFDYNGMMHLFQSRRLDLMVTPEHKMLYVKDGKWNSGRADRAFDINNLRIPISGVFSGEEGGVTAEQARLMAWIATEGSLDTSSGYPRITIYQKKPNRLREIRALLMRMGIPASFRKDKRWGVCALRIGTKHAKKILEIMPDIKRLPRRLLNSRVGVLRAAYEVLIAGDGHRHVNTDYYATTSRGLADDFQEICSKIGYSARCKHEKIRPSELIPKEGGTIFRCRVRKSDYTCVTKRELVPYSGKVYDLTTTSGFFVVRRNGLVAISGNCNLRPQFEPNNSWNHGHAIVEVANGGQFHVRNVRIHEGEMLN